MGRGNFSLAFCRNLWYPVPEVNDMTSKAAVNRIIETLKENGTYDDPSTVIPVFGINGLPDIYDMLENDQLSGTILTSPWAEACACVDTLLNVYNGKDVLEGLDLTFGEWKDIRIPNEIITKENIDVARQEYNNCL